MKLLALILSGYLLLLVATPCCVFDECTEGKSKTEQIDHSQESKEDDCGACSPFFNCGDCATFAFTVELMDLDVVPTIHPSHYPAYADSFIREVHSDFWQPPRLS